MKTLYKLHIGGNVEGKPCFSCEAIENHVKAALYRSHIDAATLTHCAGIWRGTSEPSVTVEIIETPQVAVTRIQVIDVCRQLQATLRQEEILVTIQQLDEVLLNTKGGIL